MESINPTVTSDIAATSDVQVRQFRQILVWPLQLMPLKKDSGIDNHWDYLTGAAGAGHWEELEDDFPGDPSLYQERHYREFAAFLPHVQRFLYGERASRSGRATYGESPIRIFRRTDIKAARLFFRGEDDPLDVEVVHADLYFFFDVDVVIPVVEIVATDVPLGRAQDILYRFGRAYPAGWTEDGAATNCLERVQWLDAAGAALSSSDYQARDKYFTSVCRTQTTTISSHWEFLLAPMIINQSPQACPVRYRQLEFHRMPVMAYLALGNPAAITRADYMRLAFGSAPGAPLATPYSEHFLDDFEERYCYDRFYDPARGNGWSNTRLLCSGQTFVAIGDAGKTPFTDPERGFLSQFRHQYFLVGLIAHFHRAALLMMSDRLVVTVSRLQIGSNESVSRFRHDIRQTLETFLRFTHRYYFSEISDQAPVRDIFRMWMRHLGTERLYTELREEISDMSSYLETDLLRRQAKTILQLTVTTLLSLIGTVTTGFLGMNVFAHADLPAFDRVLIFLAVFIPTTLLTFYTVMKSRRLAEFLDALADSKVRWKDKLRVLMRVWIK
ncbi:MAG: hypothetical protein EPO23_05580 [Xanthobacteraceae bacterium]|nr:MAG: hypothetical protein EPO23_05580 [Xanthobacteraceae bacterium]